MIKENLLPDVSYVAQVLTLSCVVPCECISLVLETGRQKEKSFQFQASIHFINMSTHWLGLASAQESLHKVIFPAVQCRICAGKSKISFALSGEAEQ